MNIALSIAEAAKATSIGKSSIRKAIDTGHLPVKRLGRRVLIESDRLREFIAALPEEG